MESAAEAYSVTFLGADPDATQVSAAKTAFGRVYHLPLVRRRPWSFMIEVLRAAFKTDSGSDVVQRFAFALPFVTVLGIASFLVWFTTPALSSSAAVIDKPLNTAVAVSPTFRSTFLSRLRRWAHSLRTDSIVFRLLRLAWIFCHVLRSSGVIWDRLKASDERYDVVHCNDFDTLIAGVLYKRHFGAKLVYDAHEFWPYSYGKPAGPQSWLMLNFERMFIRYTDSVLTVNPLLAETMRNAYQLVEVGSVLNSEPWISDRKPLVQSLPPAIAQAETRFIFIGGLSLERGLQEFFEAWATADLKNAALLVYGPDNRARQELMAFAQTLGPSAQTIHFLPSISEDQIVGAAMNADVGVIPYPPVTPNYRFCCPNKLSQYMHAGLMILANDTEFVASVVTKHQIGLVYDSKRPETTVQAIKQAAANAVLRRRCKDQSLALARTLFSWQAQGEQLMGIYGNLWPSAEAFRRPEASRVPTLGGAVG